MEWLNYVISAVVSLAGAFGGATLLFYRQNKVSKELDNEAKQSDEWRKLYEMEKEECDELNTKIDSLFDEIRKHRDEKNTMAKRITELEIDNTKGKIYRCEVAGCVKRHPPTGY